MNRPRRIDPLPTPPHRGLGAIAVIVVLVLLATVAAAVVRLGQQGQTMVQQDVQGLRASAAARAGIEWGLYQALKGTWTSCSSATQTLDLTADGGMRATVTCNSATFTEGQDAAGADLQVRLYTIDAVACNSATSCPDATAAVRSGYAESRRQVQATNQ
jgi:MSHA biogenesis protein MshP